MSEIYLTETEFAARYNIRPRTAQRWRSTGIGGPKYVRTGLRRVAYRLSDCEAWAAAQTFKHHADEFSRAA